MSTLESALIPGTSISASLVTMNSSEAYHLIGGSAKLSVGLLSL